MRSTIFLVVALSSSTNRSRAVPTSVLDNCHPITMDSNVTESRMDNSEAGSDYTSMDSCTKSEEEEMMNHWFGSVSDQAMTKNLLNVKPFIYANCSHFKSFHGDRDHFAILTAAFEMVYSAFD